VVDGEGNALPNNFLQKRVIESYVGNLQKRVETIRQYNQVVEELKYNIALITDDVSANDFVGRIDSFGHVGNSKAVAGQLLLAKAKELNLTLNKETKKYEKK
jgi:hypothetical protein